MPKKSVIALTVHTSSEGTTTALLLPGLQRVEIPPGKKPLQRVEIPPGKKPWSTAELFLLFLAIVLLLATITLLVLNIIAFPIAAPVFVVALAIGIFVRYNRKNGFPSLFSPNHNTKKKKLTKKKGKKTKQRTKISRYSSNSSQISPHASEVEEVEDRDETKATPMTIDQVYTALSGLIQNRNLKLDENLKAQIKYYSTGTPPNGETLLHTAIFRKDLPMVKKLLSLQQIVDINLVGTRFINQEKDTYPNCSRIGTPLYMASFLGQTDVVKLLLEAKADPNISGEDGPPLSGAFVMGETKTAKLLLEQKNIKLFAAKEESNVLIILTKDAPLYKKKLYWEICLNKVFPKVKKEISNKGRAVDSDELPCGYSIPDLRNTLNSLLEYFKEVEKTKDVTFDSRADTRNGAAEQEKDIMNSNPELVSDIQKEIDAIFELIGKTPVKTALSAASPSSFSYSRKPKEKKKEEAEKEVEENERRDADDPPSSQTAKQPSDK